MIGENNGGSAVTNCDLVVEKIRDINSIKSGVIRALKACIQYSTLSAYSNVYGVEISHKRCMLELQRCYPGKRKVWPDCLRDIHN